MKGMPSSTGGAEPRSTVCLSRRRHTASTRVDPTATATWAARGRAWRAATTAWSWSAMDGHCSNPQQLGLRSGCLPGVGSMQCAALQTLQPPPHSNAPAGHAAYASAAGASCRGAPCLARLQQQLGGAAGNLQALSRHVRHQHVLPRHGCVPRSDPGCNRAPVTDPRDQQVRCSWGCLPPRRRRLPPPALGLPHHGAVVPLPCAHSLRVPVQ